MPANITGMTPITLFSTWERSWLSAAFSGNSRISAANARIVAQRIKALRRLFAFLSIRYFIKHRKPWTTELRDMVRGEPHFLSWYLPCVAYVMLGYPLHFYDPLQDW